MRTLWLFLGVAACVDFYITSPYDVITWNIGEKATVTWNLLPGGPDINGINVDLMDGDEITANIVRSIAANLAPSATSATWEVPNDIQPGKSYFVRVSSNDPRIPVHRFSHKFTINGIPCTTKGTTSSARPSNTSIASSQTATSSTSSSPSDPSTSLFPSTRSIRRRSGNGDNVSTCPSVSVAATGDSKCYSATLHGLLYVYLVTGKAEYFQYLRSVCSDGIDECKRILLSILKTEFAIPKSNCLRNAFIVAEYMTSVDSGDCEHLWNCLLRFFVNLNEADMTKTLESIEDNLLMFLSRTELCAKILYIIGRSLSVKSPTNAHEKSILSSLVRSSSIMEILGREALRTFLGISSLDLYRFQSNTFHSVCAANTPTIIPPVRISPILEADLLYILNTVSKELLHVYYGFLGLNLLPDSLIVDTIRYIIVCYHPPNAILGSGLGQRWELVLLLMKYLRTAHGTADAKLAIFIDWFFPHSDYRNDIMLFEPGALLISKMKAINRNISLTLVEFLCHFCTHLSSSANFDSMRFCSAAFESCFELRVVKRQDIASIFENPSLGQFAMVLDVRVKKEQVCHETATTDGSLVDSSPNPDLGFVELLGRKVSFMLRFGNDPNTSILCKFFLEKLEHVGVEVILENSLLQSTVGSIFEANILADEEFLRFSHAQKVRSLMTDRFAIGSLLRKFSDASVDWNEVGGIWSQVCRDASHLSKEDLDAVHVAFVVLLSTTRQFKVWREILSSGPTNDRRLAQLRLRLFDSAQELEITGSKISQEE